jgi:hypothetical protein
MSGAATTPGASRQVRRETCTVHLVQFGQQYIKNDQTNESGWFPEFCPKCEEEFAREKRWEAEVKKQVEETAAEADKRCSADEGRAERIKEEAGRMMAEDAGNYVLNYFHENRAKYEAHVEEQDWNRVAQEVSAERREEFFERVKKTGE